MVSKLLTSEKSIEPDMLGQARPAHTATRVVGVWEMKSRQV
jgi:hypothetical protein